ncbi:MAG: hypothetical protein NTX49_05250 [Chlamydiae bacterium]|nr:hypothetical protein [Chlamydiota bacterium]
MTSKIHSLSCENLSFYSQASQDKFVFLLLYQFLGKQDAGYYLEIGASHPVHINNTYLFDTILGWKGVSIDIDTTYKNLWETSDRKNCLLTQDATKSNYRSLLQPYPKNLDYLSLDIDDHYDAILSTIPFEKHVFKIITIEHDFYRWGDKFRDSERKILTSLGYYLLCPDVCVPEGAFEDWWIYPEAFPKGVLSLLTSLDLSNKKHFEIINAMQKSLSYEKLFDLN